MSRTALYRKYRSRSLDEVVGQEHITDVLKPAIKNGVFSHAYLFTGPRGIGKTSVARIVAYLINDLPYGETSFDIIEIDAASHGLKEDIKDLIEKARIAPTREKYKVYIIDEVHSMKHDAFNTFLKLLEEPPEHVVFILATTDPQKLPATILSRAQRFHFHPVEEEKVIKHLKNISQKENIDIDEPALEMIAKRSEGSMRDSISLLDQLSGFGKKITAKAVEELLGLIPEEQVEDIIKSIDKNDMQKVRKVLLELKNHGVSPDTVVSQLNSRLLQSEYYDLVEKLLDVPKSMDPWLKIMAVIGSFVSANKILTEPSKKNEVENKPNITPKQENKTPEKVEKKEVISKNEIKPVVEEQKKKPAVSTEIENKVEEIKVEYNKAEKSAPIEIDWKKIVGDSKKLNGMCGAWISQASYEYDGEVLTLYFRNNVQRETMKSPKCWSVLKNVLKSLYSPPPVVVVSDGQKPKSEKVNKVVDIMGGGELI